MKDTSFRILHAQMQTQTHARITSARISDLRISKHKQYTVIHTPKSKNLSAVVRSASWHRSYLDDYIFAVSRNPVVVSSLGVVGFSFSFGVEVRVMTVRL